MRNWQERRLFTHTGGGVRERGGTGRRAGHGQRPAKEVNPPARLRHLTCPDFPAQAGALAGQRQTAPRPGPGGGLPAPLPICPQPVPASCGPLFRGGTPAPRGVVPGDPGEHPGPGPSKPARPAPHPGFPASQAWRLSGAEEESISFLFPLGPREEPGGSCRRRHSVVTEVFQEASNPRPRRGRAGGVPASFSQEGGDGWVSPWAAGTGKGRDRLRGHRGGRSDRR